MAVSVGVRGKRKISFGQVMLGLFLTAFAAFQALPLVYLVNTAFKPLDELFLFPPPFFVRRPTLDNFDQLLFAIDGLLVPFSRYVFNSAFVTVMVVVLAVVVSCMAAYPLAKHRRAPGIGLIFTGVVAALMFAPQVTAIPRYLIINSLGMIDTYWALILPPLAGTYNVFLVKQFMESFIPDSLLESAKIDGATEWTIFWQLVMPLIRPVWATIVIFTFVGTWNDYFSALIFTRSEAMKTLPLAMQTIYATGTVARAGAAAAGSFLTVMPTIIVYLLMQRRVLQTMAYSGIKG